MLVDKENNFHILAKVNRSCLPTTFGAKQFTLGKVKLGFHLPIGKLVNVRRKLLLTRRQSF